MNVREPGVAQFRTVWPVYDTCTINAAIGTFENFYASRLFGAFAINAHPTIGHGLPLVFTVQNASATPIIVQIFLRGINGLQAALKGNQPFRYLDTVEVEDSTSAGPAIVPSNRRVCLHDQKRLRPLRPRSAQQNPEQSVGTSPVGPASPAFQEIINYCINATISSPNS
jgi:hypothetical protein